MNRKGVTLIELLVYIVLFSVVTVFIGSQMKQLLGGYTSGRRISRLQSESRDVLAMLSREIRNAGLKTYLVNSGSGTFTPFTDPGTYLPDSSSFVHKEGNPGDTLTIYKLSLNDNGNKTGVDTIRYYLDGTTLKRDAEGKTINIAENVHALQFQYGVLTMDSMLLDQRTMILNDWPPFGVNDSGSIKFTISNSGSGSINCSKSFKIAKNQRIRVRFQISASGDFPQNLDSIKCSIKRRSSNSVITSERFLANGSELDIIMPVREEDEAIFSFDYWCHGKGELDIRSVEVRRADLGEYKWENDPVSSKKKAVKAIKIFALVRSSGKAAASSDQNISIANAQVPVSGPYVWRVVKETVEVLNNGTF